MLFQRVINLPNLLTSHMSAQIHQNVVPWRSEAKKRAWPGPLSARTTYRMIVTENWRPEKPDNMGDTLYALIDECWRTDPAARPDARYATKWLEEHEAGR